MEGTDRDVAALLGAALADPAVTWDLGGFGALATFARRPVDPAVRLDDGRPGLITARGGIALRPDGIVPFAYETAFGDAWSHAVALCLPAEACGVPVRAVLTELGPDAGAIRPEDRDAILFDAGIGLVQASLCLRSADPAMLARLRAACGAPATLASLPAPTPGLHRMMIAARGRIEVFDDGTGTDRDAPRLFADARALRGRRTHAATAPIPAGLVPFAHLHPPHPLGRDGVALTAERHEAFQALLRRWGDPRLVALKSALEGGEPLPEEAGRHDRMVAKVVAVQARSFCASG